MDFYINDTIAVGKRLNNSKRNYLLINRFQAKHIPCSPSQTFKMYDDFAILVMEKVREGKLLIIGFAETATAISMHVASYFPDSFYLQTTREYPGVYQDFLIFSEPHSHATEQKICSKELSEIIDSVSAVLIIDDEISTGNTVINLIDKINEKYSLEGKKLYVASLLNRKGSLNKEAFDQKGITNIALMCEDTQDFDYLNNYQYSEPLKINSLPKSSDENIFNLNLINNPRIGFYVKDYFYKLNQEIDCLFYVLDIHAKKIVVIGTEEYMYPSLLLAKKIETECGCTVKCHSTTRSPISICSSTIYPIFNGYILHSAYDKERTTYLYNIDGYDTAIIFTDSDTNKSAFYEDIASVLKQNGTNKVIFVEATYDK